MTLRTLAMIALLVLAAPAAAQEAPKAQVEPDPFPVQAAAWCIVRDDKNEAPGPELGEDGEALEPEPPAPGCDVGIGLALHRWRRASWVAVLGQETLGTGIAWVPYRPARGPIPAVALGVVVRYGSEGIDGSEVYLALGTTLAFRGRQPGG